MIIRSILLVLSLACSTDLFAVDRLNSMQRLENEDLRNISGQKMARELMSDPYALNIHYLRQSLQLFMNSSDLQSNALLTGEAFHVNDQGELWLSIQQGSISVHLIECALTFNVSNQSSKNWVSEVKFY